MLPTRRTSLEISGHERLRAYFEGNSGEDVGGECVALSGPIGSLCGANAKSFSDFPLVVVEVPPGRRPEWNPHQRVSWGIVINGEVQPLG